MYIDKVFYVDYMKKLSLVTLSDSHKGRWRCIVAVGFGRYLDIVMLFVIQPNSD